MTVKLKPQVHEDADYDHLVNCEFEVADFFFEPDIITLKNGDGVIYVEREDVILQKGYRHPTDKELVEGRWLPEESPLLFTGFNPSNPQDE